MSARAAALMLALLLLSACGQKGPLYIPGDEEPPEPADEPTAEDD